MVKNRNSRIALLGERERSAQKRKGDETEYNTFAYWKLEDIKQGIKLRRKFAEKIFIMLSVWLALIMVIIFFSGFEFHSFKLSDGVLITLITTTTANVVAFFLVVTRHLFPLK